MKLIMHKKKERKSMIVVFHVSILRHINKKKRIRRFHFKFIQSQLGVVCTDCSTIVLI